jgi:hypothetical protein
MTSVVQIGRHAASRLCTSESTAWCPVYEWRVNKFWHNYSMIICVCFSSFLMLFEFQMLFKQEKCCHLFVSSSASRYLWTLLHAWQPATAWHNYRERKGLLVIACISLLFNFVDVYQLLSSLVFYFFIVTGWMLLYRPRSRGSEVFWYDI